MKGWNVNDRVECDFQDARDIGAMTGRKQDEKSSRRQSLARRFSDVELRTRVAGVSCRQRSGALSKAELIVESVYEHRVAFFQCFRGCHDTVTDDP
jgi:hypothetical protein